MKNVIVNGKEVQVKTSLDEINITQFEQALIIFKKDYSDSIEQYIDIIQLLSPLTKEEIEDLDLIEFENLVKAIEINTFNMEPTSFINEIVIDGETFKSKSDGLTYKVNVKEIFLLQELIKANPESYVLDLASIIFLEVDAYGNPIKNYTPEAIAIRKNKLSKIDMGVMSAYVVIISKYFIDKKKDVK